MLIHVSENIAKKIAWTVVFMFLSALTAWNTMPMVQEVLSFPVQVAISNVDSSGVEEVFPAVTVCLLNQVNCIRLTRGYLENREELGDVMQWSGCAVFLGRNPSLLKQVQYLSNDKCGDVLN